MTILIVEDDAISARIVDVNLKKQNYQTVVAYSAKEALEHLMDIPQIQLVIMDIMMPEMDGLELLSRLKETPEWENIPVIMCTALADAETVKKAVNLGCKHYVIKPINARVLLEKVEELLGKEKPVIHDKYRIMSRSGLDAKSFSEVTGEFADFLSSKIAILEQQLEERSITMTLHELRELEERAAIFGAERVMDTLYDLVSAIENRKLNGEGLADECRILLRELKTLQNALPFKTAETDVPSAPDEGELVGADAPLLFGIEDLKYPSGLARKLKEPQDPVSQYLLEQFSADTKQLLSEYEILGPPSGELIRAIIEELNRLLRQGTLYNEKRFANVSLTENTRELAKKRPEDDELIRLNRLLLEETYPEEIAKINGKAAPEKKHQSAHS